MAGVVTAALVATSLSAVVAPANAEPTTTVVNNGPPANRVDLAVVGDGYTANEMGTFQADVVVAVNGLFGAEAMAEYAPYFNVHRIDVASNQSGADHPERQPPVFVDTAFDATYNCAQIQRLLCVNGSKVQNVVSQNLPPAAADFVLVLVNDLEYGGAGGAIATASRGASVVELVLHELVGHGLGLLADEYFAGSNDPSCSSGEPSEANATRATVRPTIKWNAWIAASTPVPTLSTAPGVPGLYEGGRFCTTGVYRPTYNSKMRSLSVPFEQVNNEQIVRRVYGLVSPIDGSLPTASSVQVTPGGGSQAFSVSPLAPATHTLAVRWDLDGVQIATTPSYMLNTAGLSPGRHTVTVTVTDPTTFVRSDPTGLLTDSRSWSVEAAGGRFTPLTPSRLPDTRSGNGAPVARLGTAGTLSLQVTGRGGVPATGVPAVVLNVTAIDATAPTFLTAWPAG